jgi:hypothetical protein
LEGTVDLIVAITLTTIYGASAYMGPAYWIPAFWVPALLVTHCLEALDEHGSKRAFRNLISIVAIGAGWLALRPSGGCLNWLFAALAFGPIVYGIALTATVRSRPWFGREHSINARGQAATGII